MGSIGNKRVAADPEGLDLQPMDDALAPPAMNGSTESASIAAASSAPQAPVRDRIVILGRRRSGKTIFLARLYEQLWRSTGRLHMRAISGDTHKACMQVIDDLSSGRWPASTLGSQYSDIDVTYRGEKHLLVVLDYPGEVFRKAFVENSDAEDARELLDHVDRAAAAILLLDPQVIEDGGVMEAMDDDYGMVQAVHRIREWPGGDTVPLVVVFTKYDQHKWLLREHGGLKAFATKKYPALMRAMNHFVLFTSTAVKATVQTDGKTVPNIAAPPVGITEPLEYCLTKLVEQRQNAQEREDQVRRVRVYAEQVELAHQAHKRAIIVWSIFWSVALVVLLAVGVITWVVIHPGAVP